MSKIAVAVDGSTNGDLAFLTALDIVQSDRGDELFVISVAETYPYDISGLNESIVNTHKDILSKYAKRCAEAKVKRFRPVLGKSDNCGSMIASICFKKGVDLLVVGRRGMSAISRVLAGSTSRYLLEHADCNVLIVKGDYLLEHHDPISTIDKMEEAERKRRMGSVGGLSEVHVAKAVTRRLEEHERARRMGYPTPEEVRKQRSALDKNIAIMAEEQERRRRLEEDKKLDEAEERARRSELIAAVLEEEDERKRRMAEEEKQTIMHEGHEFELAFTD